MKQWIKKLLSDVNGLPSTRLHLAWALFVAIMVSICLNKDATTIGILTGAMTTLAGVSAFEKKSEDK